ncbi:hypothetical protein CC86DRAFT_424879 [Ophiobolus disseminans]|uniref:Integral membrane protein TmpA n=1 Tax=Ophiobolus disseminans TaxID=1469910 RepID=A0A6A7AIJ9_9PLEO|nr:hypothetical protein CC86DRAFT_424879 [Ophiobolus disseminans]
MSTSSTKSQCYHAWGLQIPRAAHEQRHHSGDTVGVSLPLPSLPPPMDFDPYQFTLPPSYNEAIDIEKAAHPLHPQERRFSKSSTLCQSWTSSEYSRPNTKIVQDLLETPIRRDVRIYRCLRYTIFTAYRRLLTFVFVLNIVGALILFRKVPFRLLKERDYLKHLSTLASSNFLLAILIRQEYLISILFRTAWLVPWSAPLWVRRRVARIYCYGGIHSGAAVAGTLWWILFTAVMSWNLAKDETHFDIVLTAWILSLLLLTILLLAYPTLRARYHNSFEMTHRFFGWLAIAIFWMQLMLLARYTSRGSVPHKDVGRILLHDPTLYNLTLITALLLYPWLRLRRWTFTAHILSPHALRLTFPHRIHRFSCLSISSSPLREWHPFATFPTGPSTSIVLSNAGDWTRNVIATASKAVDKLPKGSEAEVQISFWIKSHPKPGVLSLSLLFPRILILTTGSGIGPALSSLLERPANQFARLVWSARAPASTYGKDIMALVDKADPEALVLDTQDMGRPDLLAVAWSVGEREGVDAVFVLSNERVTRWVVGGLEGRGRRAYGPIWDS